MTTADGRRFRLLRGLLTAPSDPNRGPALGREYAELARKAYVGRFAPGIDDATDQLRRMVDELAATGALDEGTGAIFDDMIDAWAAQWHAEIDVESSARRSLLELSEAEARAQLELHRSRMEWAEAMLAEANRQLAEAAAPRRVGNRAGLSVRRAALFRMFRQRLPRPGQSDDE